MSRTDLSDEALVERLTRALEARAADVGASTEPFEPAPRGAHDVPAPRGVARRRPLAAAAAVVVVVGLAAGVVVVRAARDPDDGPVSGAREPDVETGEPSEDVGPPDGVLVPMEVPDDLALRGVEWAEDSRGPMFTQQLFQRADGAGVVIEVQRGDGGRVGGEPVTVRGLPATWMPAKEFADTDTSLFWSEGASLIATYSGLTQVEAVALLDSLTWRSADRIQGFAPPEGGEFELRAEAVAAPDGGGAPVLVGRFGYVDDPASTLPGAGRQVEVRTTTGPSSLTTSSSSLQPLLHGEPRADGGVEAYDPDFGSLTVRWPDGRTVWVDANDTPVTRDELRAIADGVAPVSGAALTALEADVTAELIAVTEIVAQADLPSGTVSVRRFGGGELVCVTPSDGDEVCPDLFSVSATPASEGMVVSSSLLVDGTWWVVAAAAGPLSAETAPDTAASSGLGGPGGTEQGPDGQDGTIGPIAPGAQLGDPIPAERAPLNDGRTALLVRPEPSVETIVVAAGGHGEEVRRPG